MAQDTVTNLAEVIAEVNALDDKIENMETLDTLEEIEANTESEVIAGALAVKELNSSLANLNDDGKIVSTRVEYVGDDDANIYQTIRLEDGTLIEKKLGSEPILLTLALYGTSDTHLRQSKFTVGLFNKTTLSSNYVSSTNGQCRATFDFYKDDVIVKTISQQDASDDFTEDISNYDYVVIQQKKAVTSSIWDIRVDVIIE